MNAYPETPIMEMKKPDDAGNRLFIKRDDLLPFSFGGNKVRIAAEFLADMKEKHGTGMIFYGDRRSNLCRVLAAMCAAENIPCLMIATEEHAGVESEPFNSRLIRMYGVPVIRCEKSGIAEAVDAAQECMREKGLVPYYIYGSRLGTGNEGIAARAYAAAYGEIRAFEKRAGFAFDMIFTPYGTGATQGGLIAGSLERGEERKIVGISISSRTAQRASEILARTVCDYFLKKGSAVPSGLHEALCLETKYNGGGYGLYGREILQTMADVMRQDGIPLDPTYTGKAFLGMENYLKEHGIGGKKILFLHTGGLPLYFDYLREENEHAGFSRDSLL